VLSQPASRGSDSDLCIIPNNRHGGIKALFTKRFRGARVPSSVPRTGSVSTEHPKCEEILPDFHDAEVDGRVRTFLLCDCLLHAFARFSAQQHEFMQPAWVRFDAFFAEPMTDCARRRSQPWMVSRVERK